MTLVNQINSSFLNESETISVMYQSNLIFLTLQQLPKAKQRPPDLIDERSIPTTDSNRSRLFLLATGTFLLGIGSVLAYSALKDSVS